MQGLMKSLQEFPNSFQHSPSFSTESATLAPGSDQHPSINADVSMFGVSSWAVVACFILTLGEPSVQVFHSKFLDAKGLPAMRVSTQIRTNAWMRYGRIAWFYWLKKHVLHPCVRHGVSFHPTGATPCLLSGPSCKAGKMRCFARVYTWKSYQIDHAFLQTCAIANPTSIPTTSKTARSMSTRAFQLHVSSYSVWSWQPTACTRKNVPKETRRLPNAVNHFLQLAPRTIYTPTSGIPLSKVCDGKWIEISTHL